MCEGCGAPAAADELTFARQTGEEVRISKDEGAVPTSLTTAFRTRMGLLSLCKTHHWQFDELRFARYSSRMLLHVLHNDLCFAADMQRAVSGTGIDSEGKGKASGLLECKLEPAFAREESSRLALSPLSPRSAAGSKCAALALARSVLGLGSFVFS
mmetsp:Transcript_20643/g.48874  ORF Transcript_20643/g.48874 Transcript_20643/m.48874 type:complete len:156 (+) Transcript_20643:1-468(+)